MSGKIRLGSANHGRLQTSANPCLRVIGLESFQHIGNEPGGNIDVQELSSVLQRVFVASLQASTFSSIFVCKLCWHVSRKEKASSCMAARTTLMFRGPSFDGSVSRNIVASNNVFFGRSHLSAWNQLLSICGKSLAACVLVSATQVNVDRTCIPLPRRHLATANHFSTEALGIMSRTWARKLQACVGCG